MQQRVWLRVLAEAAGRVAPMALARPAAEELTLLKHLDRLDQEGRAGRSRADDDRWETYLDEMRGAQRVTTSGNPMFQANLIGPAVDKKVALLTEAKPTMFIAPRRPGLLQTAKTLQKTIEAGWDEYAMDLVLEDLAYCMEVLGAGFVKLSYDPQTAQGGVGDVVPTAWDPRQVWIDPQVKRSYQLPQARFIITETAEPLFRIWQRYPGRGALVTFDASASSYSTAAAKGLFQRTVDRARRAWGTDATEPSAIPMATLREYQFLDPTLDHGVLRYPFGRHVIRAGDVILSDTPNPYWDGAWDLVMLDGRPDLDHPWGRSEVAALRRINEAFNRTGHKFVESTLLTGNAWLITDADALDTEAVNKITNAGGIVITKRFGRTVDRQAPPQMPTQFLDFQRFAIQLIDLVTGLGDGGQQGSGRVELRSGAQLDGLMQAGQTLVRALARRLETFLERLGYLWISRIFQFYNADRMLTFLGKNEEFLTFEFERQALLRELVDDARRQVEARDPSLPPDLLRQQIETRVRGAYRDFRFRVTPGSSLAVTRVQRGMMMMQLAQAGMVSRFRVPEALGMDTPKEEAAQALQEMQQFGPLAGPPGKKK